MRLNTEPLHAGQAEAFESLLHPDRLAALLPEVERKRYEEAQQSVIEARRSAERIEGQIWIS